MTFVRASTGGNCNECSWIAAIGTITAETPLALEEALGPLDPGDTFSPIVAIHSPGGDLVASLEVGRILRQHRAHVLVAATTNIRVDPWIVQATPDGLCASACVYAFMGGVTRTVESGSRLGLHQFRSARPEATKLIAAELELAGFSLEQLVFGLLAEYVSEMGISGQVLSRAAQVPANDVEFISQTELQSFGLVTSRAFLEWDIEPYGNGLIAFSRAGDAASRAFPIHMEQ